MEIRNVQLYPQMTGHFISKICFLFGFKYKNYIFFCKVIIQYYLIMSVKLWGEQMA